QTVSGAGLLRRGRDRRRIAARPQHHRLEQPAEEAAQRARARSGRRRHAVRSADRRDCDIAVTLSRDPNMPHLVDELRADSEAAIAAMRDAALRARRIHARAELMRHMLLTAHKVKSKPKADAVEAVVTEWMKAWHLTRSDWPQLAREMEAFTAAFYD